MRLDVSMHSEPKAGDHNTDQLVNDAHDEYSQPSYSDEHVNLECVLSCRRRGSDIHIDFPDGRRFNSAEWPGRKESLVKLRALLGRGQL
jgi:hypothetical protein